MLKDPDYAPQMLQDAFVYQTLQKSTGLTYAELGPKVNDLSQRHQTLTKQVAEKEKVVKDLDLLTQRRNRLQADIKTLDERKATLQQDNSGREARLERQAKRAEELEETVHGLNLQLAAARKALEEASAFGITAEQIPGVASRLQAVAHRHRWKVANTVERFLNKLEQFDADATLQEKRVAAQTALQIVEDKKKTARKALASLTGEISALETEKAQKESYIDRIGEQLVMQLLQAGDRSLAAADKATRQFDESRAEFFAKAMELARGVGGIEANLRSYEWYDTLSRMLRRDSTVERSAAASAAVIVLTAIRQWYENNLPAFPQHLRLQHQLDTLIKTFKLWGQDQQYA